MIANKLKLRISSENKLYFQYISQFIPEGIREGKCCLFYDLLDSLV